MDKIKRFEKITEEMQFLYDAKNSDYADSFGESIREFGLIAGVVRIYDKCNRLKQLIKNGYAPKVDDESIIDTLTDLANYAVMLRIEVENINQNGEKTI